MHTRASATVHLYWKPFNRFRIISKHSHPNAHPHTTYACQIKFNSQIFRLMFVAMTSACVIVINFHFEWIKLINKLYNVLEGNSFKAKLMGIYVACIDSMITYNPVESSGCRMQFSIQVTFMFCRIHAIQSACGSATVHFFWPMNINIFRIFRLIANE